MAGYFWSTTRSLRCCRYEWWSQALCFCATQLTRAGSTCGRPFLFLFSVQSQGLSCRPYLHIYCAYFLGWSEVSTVFLCLLVFFDKNHGIQYFADKAPNLLTAIGVAFACSFIVFRIVLWPYVRCGVVYEHVCRCVGSVRITTTIEHIQLYRYVNYFFWVDMYDMLIKDQFHNRMVGAIYCIVSAGLTILQFYWLGDIVHEAKKHFGGSTSNPAPVPNESSSKKGN